MDNGFGCGGFGGLGVFGLAVHDADAVEEELGDVGHGHGVFAGDAIVGDLGEEVGEGEVYGSGGAEIAGAVEESGGDGGGFFAPLRMAASRFMIDLAASFGGDAFCLRVSVEGAEGGAVRG